MPDTNVVVSAALRPEGLQRTILLVALTKPAKLHYPNEILSEYRESLGERDRGLAVVRRKGRMVEPARRIRKRATRMTTS